MFHPQNDTDIVIDFIAVKLYKLSIDVFYLMYIIFHLIIK